jgi:hypothetical protein
MIALATTLLILGLVGQDVKPEPGESVVRVPDMVIASEDVPDELAPALLPFMNCLAASNGIPVVSDGRSVPPPPGITRGSDCSASRQQAQVRGDQILRSLGVEDSEQRRSRIEAALLSAENFAAMSSNPPPPPRPTEPEGKSLDTQK